MKFVGRSLLPALGVLLVFSVLFGLWFKSRQLSYVSPELSSVYPLMYWIDTVATAFLFFAIPGLAALLIVQSARAGLLSKAAREHLPAAGVLFLVNFVFAGFTSPLARWDAPMTSYAWQESPINQAGSLPYRALFFAAKQFDFSGFDTSYWSSISHSSSNQNSLLFSHLAWLFDLPVVDFLSYYRLDQGICFFWLFLGAFGFYLFARRALLFSQPVSVLGGICYAYGNIGFSVCFTHFYITLAGMYLTLPYVLLLSRLAVRELKPAFAFGAGLAQSLYFYLYPGHPDPIILGCSFSALYLLVHVCFMEGRPPLLLRLRILAAFGAAFSLGSLHFTGPILESISTLEYQLWGHSGHSPFSYEMKQGFGLLYPILSSYSLLFFGSFCLVWRKELHSQRRTDLAFFCGIFLFLSIVLVAGKSSPLGVYLNERGAPPGFSNPLRIWMYLALAAIVLSLFSFERIIHWRGRRVSLFFTLAILVIGALVFTKIFWRGPLPSDLSTIPWKAIPLGIVAGYSLLALSLWARRFFQRENVREIACVASFALVIYCSPGGNLLRGAPRVNPKNPKGCPPYIALQTQVAIYEKMGFEDSPSLRYFRRRLCRYEADSGTRVGSGSACNLPLDQVFSVARKSYHPFDDFYLGGQGCWYPEKFTPVGYGNFFIANFNNTAALSGLDDRFKKTLFAVGSSDYQLMVGGGHLIHNGTSATVDTRYLAAFPPINAVYLTPGFIHPGWGSHRTLLPWEFTPSLVEDATVRRLMNIGGIDAFLFPAEEYAATKDKRDMVPIKISMPERLRPPYVLVEDKRSYGVAYLARSVRHVPQRSSDLMEDRYPIRNPDRWNRFKETVNYLTRELVSPSPFRSVILESASSSPSVLLPEGNTLSIASVGRGNKAAFHVGCEKPPCLMVLNYADLNGWKAFVDDKPAPIQRANFAFMAVNVPHGKHLVWFEHRRWGLVVGTYLSLLANVLGLAWLFVSSARQMKKSP